MKTIKSIYKLCVYVLLCVLTLSSCYTTKTGLHPVSYTVDDFPAFRKQCIGQSYNQIVTALGAPQRRSPDGNGGNILIYENSETTSISNSIAKAYDVNYFTRTYTPGVETSTKQITTTYYVHYFVDSKNYCYEVKTNIPMKHTETKEVYGKYKKISYGKIAGLSFGITAPIAVLLAIIGAKK